MRVEKLILRNFRNYLHLAVEFNRGINVFTGFNAQGKTNVLEALYFGALGRSHRTLTEEELIYWNYPAAIIDIRFFRQEIPNHLHFKLIAKQNQNLIKNSHHNKEILLNDYPLSARELIGSLNAVLFSPEDLMLIKGAPALRRRFLDNEISQANPAYYRQLLLYNRILLQRNNLLKKIRERRAAKDMLSGWDNQLAETAAVLTSLRRQSVQKLTMLANLHHRRLTGSSENLLISYCLQTGLIAETAPEDNRELARWYLISLQNLQAEDIMKGSTGIGPHRDDLCFAVNGRNLKNYGSQGQQRTGVLAVKLAELEFIKSETGEYPILLLDDVMSELDAARRNELLLFIKDKIQTFITATDESYFPEIKTNMASACYDVQAGTLRLRRSEN